MNPLRFLRRCSLLLLLHGALGAQQPKLVVVVVLDQFPYDYLERFEPYFGQGGFRYLLERGANFSNARYEYATTKTAPGHAALLTGSYNHRDGIVANSWWDRDRQRRVSSVDDDSVTILGHRTPGHSPKNLLTYTAGDMLRVGSNFHSKVVSIAHKDRSAVLMGGKFGSAYWIEDSLVVTSTYYRKELPAWADEFNHSHAIESYFGKEWTELRPGAAAMICDDDGAAYEDNPGKIGITFPHRITGDDPSRMTPSFYRSVEFSPFAIDYLFDIVRRACVAESLGLRGQTDMLCVGISITDEIGHAFGPRSHEVFDNALRTDAMLADFFSFLDKRIGLANCLIACSSDHGISPIPESLKKLSPEIPAGRIAPSAISALVTAQLESSYGPAGQGKKWVEAVVESDVYINRTVLSEKQLLLDRVTALLKDSLAYRSPFVGAYTRSELQRGGFSDRLGQAYEKAFYAPRSGDIVFVLKPYYIISGETNGTNHGQPYDYDSHVPLLFAGGTILPGIYRNEVSPVDLAPTICSILRIEFPPSREGRVLKEAIR
jgi:predicted AlkP superfamily pyrophosphatase or phosphodiesterase